MSNVNGVGAASAPPSEGLVGTMGLSSDALLEYCQMQLSSLDGTMGTDMQEQQTQLAERTAVNQAQTALEQLGGSSGPQDPATFEKCMAAIDQAAQSLPAGDPVAAQLESFKQSMMTQYGYVPVGTQAFMPRNVAGLLGMSHQVADQTNLTSELNSAPQGGQWQGTTDALGNIASNIKSNSDIQMLQLQDLVSQRQQAISLASGMMSKEDQTLEDEAKAIGQ